ncbi:MAG: universal stress protein [Bacteroidetes bacterium]|nr:universal stress protein [Bacteroidota bacterium]MBU1374118.1 universal stress protein [Bacteroidota bacterium]MBU1484542.1 universal stress protein [Bacteroidota bacterium]MBU1759628.1 universal stress protein [Bacteroidota bacterium]MBU2045824.1 universal stress protein [Bacteroidota bacterium]
MKNLKHFEKILIAVDDSKYSYHAAEYGFELAKKLNSSVALVHINEFPIAINITGDPILGDTGMIMPEVMDIQKQNSEELLMKLKTELAGDLSVEQHILIGDITHEIIELAKSYNASLIVMGTHGRTGFNHFISGSVAENVTRHAKCPVLIVPNKD